MVSFSIGSFWFHCFENIMKNFLILPLISTDTLYRSVACVFHGFMFWYPGLVAAEL